VEEKYADITFLGANNDSRKIQPGQLFLALQGERDGHDFIPMAMEKGAAAVLCSRKVGDYPAIYVDDPRIALGQIAHEVLKSIGCRVVGVTGSVGKSTTKEMISAVLSSIYRISKTPANHNNDIGMPMAVLSMPEDTQIAVLEMGMNHFREIAYLSNIANPDVAVIINVGTMHIEHLGSREGIRKAKMEIVEGMAADGKLLLSGDNDLLRNLDEIPVQPITYFGCDDGCAVWASDICQSEESLAFNVHTDKGDFPVKLYLQGEHFVPDALAAVAVGLAMDVPVEDIQRSLTAFENMAGRQEIFRAGEYTIIKDCYNAGPESMAAALNVLGSRNGRKVAVLGDMLELGDHAPEEHRKLGELAAQKAELILFYGPNAPYVVEGSGGKAIAFDDRDAMTAALKELAQSGDVILFKASHGMHLELALEQFLK
jgi:UDP-N-acetylmuramoyl-tripeptide--D-alanyl-D-alanine ligase